MVSDKYFAKEIEKRIGVQTDTTAIDKELANYESKLKEVDLNKARLEREIDNLPIDARFRERKIHDMTLRLDALYDTIVELEERIEDAKLRKSSIEMETITLDNIYKLMLNFGKLYDIISDEEKKSLITYLIKEIQIYPNGESEQPLKSIEFNFPIYRDGQEVRRLLWEKGNTVETFTQVPDYTVTFQADGTTVKTMTVEDGYTLKDSDYPAVPTKTGYTGEWVKYTSAVHSNVTVQAKYTAVVTKYTVTFKADDTVVKTMTVKDGYTLKASDYPTVPAKSGYKGSWKRYTAAIHSDITIDAVYEPVIVTKQYTVVFRADAKVLKTMKVEVGYTLQDSDYPEIPAKEGYTGHWDKSTTRIIKNTIINVIYSDNSSHVVTFIFDGAQIGTLTVTDGYVLKNSDYPSPFAPVGYIVTWEKYTLPIHSDITVTGKLQSDVTIPPQPTSPGEIMSGGDGEPVEADAPAKDETVSPQGTHVTGTQTVTHEYLTLNGKVARETIKTNNSLTAVLDFVYDESGKPFALKYSTNGTSFQTYYYVLNLQGDVVKLIHYIPGFEYESVATYEYDAWGNIVSSSGRLAEINPLRYRGYYYDNETGFYYLQSRYYDPANRRFINADSLASTGQGILGSNMFAYVNNDPVNCIDPWGRMVELVVAEKSDSIPVGFATKLTAKVELVVKIPVFDDVTVVIGKSTAIESISFVAGLPDMQIGGTAISVTETSESYSADVSVNGLSLSVEETSLSATQSIVPENDYFDMRVTFSLDYDPRLGMGAAGVAVVGTMGMYAGFGFGMERNSAPPLYATGGGSLSSMFKSASRIFMSR